MITPGIMDAIFVVSEERGLSINEVITACENIMHADIISKNSNVEIEQGDKQIYEEVLKVYNDKNLT